MTLTCTMALTGTSCSPTSVDLGGARWGAVR